MGTLQCSIRRDKAGFSKKFYPKYDLFLSSNEHFIMAGQKMQIMRSAYYLVCLDGQNMSKSVPGYLGKLRSNLVGTEFNMFGEGENPDTHLPPQKIRDQHGAVFYV